MNNFILFSFLFISMYFSMAEASGRGTVGATSAKSNDLKLEFHSAPPPPEFDQTSSSGSRYSTAEPEPNPFAFDHIESDRLKKLATINLYIERYSYSQMDINPENINFFTGHSHITVSPTLENYLKFISNSIILPPFETEATYEEIYEYAPVLGEVLDNPVDR